MLIAWKQKVGCEATYKVLYDTLCHNLVECKLLAEQYCCNKIVGNASPQSYTIETESFLYYVKYLCEYSKERLCRAFALSKSFVFLAIQDRGKIVSKKNIFTRIFALKSRQLKNTKVRIHSDVQNNEESNNVCACATLWRGKRVLSGLHVRCAMRQILAVFSLLLFFTE